MHQCLCLIFHCHVALRDGTGLHTPVQLQRCSIAKYQHRILRAERREATAFPPQIRGVDLRGIRSCA